MLRLFANPRLLAATRYAGYALFFCLVATIAVPFTFPARQLRSFVTRQARAQGYPIEIEDLKLHGLGGIELLGVHLTMPGKPGEADENGQMTPSVPETELRIDRLNARVALWSALMGKSIDVHFEMDAGNGTLQDGRFTKKGDDFDFELGQLKNIALGEMGIGNRLLAGNKALSAGVDGDLSGTAKLHYGNGGEDMSGDVDLELADAILKSPELEGGLRMTDLGLGTVTLKVKIGLKSNIAALAAARGSDKATVIYIEKMEAGGDGADVEILTDETAHILIPPGKGMLKQATLQLHFAINLNEKEKKPAAKSKEGEKVAKADASDEDEAADEEKPEKVADDRVKWSKILTLFGAKLKPFERAGFIGIGCTGPLLRPQCKPELPVVSVGTRGKAPLGGTGPEGQTPPPPPTTPGPTPPTAPTVVATPVPTPEFRPAMAPPQPTPQPTPPPAPEPPKVEEKKPEPAKVEPPMDDKKPADDEGGRGRGRRGRNVEEDDKRDRGNAEDDEDKPRKRGEGEEGGDEPPGEDRGN
jgi:type II secretion system protein N